MFRKPEKLIDHFLEHGEATGCDSAEEYLIKANAVIQNSQAKTKHETDEDDNDKDSDDKDNDGDITYNDGGVRL